MEADFTKVAKMLASPARSAMVGALFDGRALTATELANIAGVARSTGSEHLGELLQGGLVRVVAQGRHRYFVLAGTDVAEALEALSRICPPTPVRSLRASMDADALRVARTCYDHLAGSLGVALLEALVGSGWLVGAEDGFVVSPYGHERFAELDLDVAALQHQRRRFACSCLDWTARRPHLAGALGAAIAASLLERKWLERESRRRAIRVTAIGKTELAKLLGIRVGDRGEILCEPRVPDMVLAGQ